MEPHSLIAQYQLEPYRGSYDKLQQIAVMFTGTPRATGDPGKVLLLNDPGSRHSFYYEFRTEDIVYAEEGATLSLPDGSTATT
ncbi:MAG: hypothetical protein GWO16_04640, partial [Gammaproteobacteria bacterium]|nr:hypothetical protein [Gammaproteobacteria bacterium]NIR97384.1 hypothetical protein [Gammaproteobacteria bacterium]NIT63037.1 hypothetical protein [Gammaproteobacteria bacterium]NIV19999.1 hypothetical protein [Gammaproteobacteria bacterium]NIY31617.1 hypothetical protein [Gammaproteobacteria bacterium]